MKLLPVLLFIFFSVAEAADTSSVLVEPVAGGQTQPQYRFVWEMEPGVRYEPQTSPDLVNWTALAGWPAEAVQLTGTHELTLQAGEPQFFRLVRFDDQAPEIIESVPASEDFAVRRFSTVTVTLADYSGIDPDSVAMTVGGYGPYTLADAQLSLIDNVLTFDLGGDEALGAYGDTVTAALTVADAEGNSAYYTWEFSLELEAVVSADIFVFGSPDAQRAGQRVGAIPTRVLADRLLTGPIRMNSSATPWWVEEVSADSIVIGYEDEAPNLFEGKQVANLTPVRISDIFYRRIVSVSDDPVNHQMTLQTVDLDSLEDIIEQGSAGINSESYLMEIGEDGTITRAFAFDETVKLERLGFSLDGASFSLREDGYSFSYEDISLSSGEAMDYLSVTAEKLHFWLQPSIQVKMDIGFTGLQEFRGALGGDVDAAIVLDAEVLLAGLSAEFPIFEIPREPVDQRPDFWVFVAQIGPVPVYARGVFDLAVKAEAEATSTLSFRSGVEFDASAAFGIDYLRGRSPAIDWIRDMSLSPRLVRPEANLNGELSLKLKLVPSFSFLVYGLAGAEASVVPSGGVVFEAALMPEPTLAGKFVSSVALNIKPAGPALDWIDPMPELSLGIWEDEWHLFPESDTLIFTRQPENQSAEVGQTVRFTCSVSRTKSVTYQWYHDGEMMPPSVGRTQSLEIVGASYADAGTYYVVVNPGTDNMTSASATLNMIPTRPDGALVSTQIINASAKTNPLGEGQEWWASPNPVQVSLQAGRYYIYNIGKADGGSYNAWRVNQVTPATYFSHYSLSIGSMTNFYYDGWDQIKASTEADALAAARPLYLELDAPTTLYFGIPDNRTMRGTYDDNSGGVSLKIENYGTSGQSTGSGDLTYIPSPLPTMVYVPGGTFEMVGIGEVTVASFYIGNYEVSWGEWQRVRNWASGRGYDLAGIGAGCANYHPVHSINRYDAMKWCNAKSEKEGLTPVYTVDGEVYRQGESDPVVNTNADGYRVPTTPEWEFAARGGLQSQGYTYSGSDTLDEVGWFRDNSSGGFCDLVSGLGTHPIGQKLPNELGLYDMSGNLGELCSDAYMGYDFILCGGFFNRASYVCTVSAYERTLPIAMGVYTRNFMNGLRLVRNGQ